jgi:hypothetical protein
MTGKRRGQSRRQFLGSALAAVAAGSLLEKLPALAVDGPTPKANLWIGTATADITPSFRFRYRCPPSVQWPREIRTGLTANVLAVESRAGGLIKSQAILIVCDLCYIAPDVLNGLHEYVVRRLPGFNGDGVFIDTAYANFAAMLARFQYDEPPFVRPNLYQSLLYQRIAEAVVKAWGSRAPGAIAGGRGRALLARSYPVILGDSFARVSRVVWDFEGYDEHDFEIIGAFDDQKRVKAAIITRPYTTPGLPGNTIGSNEFWQDACQLLRGRYGEELCVLGYQTPVGGGCAWSPDRNTSEARGDQGRGRTGPQHFDRGIGSAFYRVAEPNAKEVRGEVRQDHPYLLTPGLFEFGPFADSARQCWPRNESVDRLCPGVYRLCLGERRKHLCAMEFHMSEVGDVAITGDGFAL